MVEDPITTEERRKVAATFVADVGFKMPALLDQVDDAVSKAYQSHPDRLYLIGRDGKIAYAGARGPMGFKPAELQAAIVAELDRRGEAKTGTKTEAKKATESGKQPVTPNRGN